MFSLQFSGYSKFIYVFAHVCEKLSNQGPLIYPTPMGVSFTPQTIGVESSEVVQCAACKAVLSDYE